MAADNNQEEYNVSLYERVASGGPETITPALEMLKTYGYNKPADREELKNALAIAAIENGDDALAQIADFHPDKDFILANVRSQLPVVLAPQSHSFANASGKHTPCMNPAHHHNDCGCNKKYSDVGHTGTEIAPAAAADIAASNKSATHDLTSFAIILVLAIGGLGILSMILGQGFLHMKHKD